MPHAAHAAAFQWHGEVVTPQSTHSPHSDTACGQKQHLAGGAVEGGLVGIGVAGQKFVGKSGLGGGAGGDGGGGGGGGAGKGGGGGVGEGDGHGGGAGGFAGGGLGVKEQNRYSPTLRPHRAQASAPEWHQLSDLPQSSHAPQ